ncbi:MAG: Chitodextrinase precursor, partial [Bacteroidota bacterium]
SSTNEIQNLSVSITGDTLYISAGNYIIVPGISDTNYPPMDIDGNNYDTVHIGTQIWMKQNLNVSRYNTGSPIPLVTGTNWKDLTTGARTYYNNDSSTNAPIYGALYNRFATMGDSICPTGWHVPTDAEWGILETYLGGSTGAGNKLKEIGTSTWNSNTGATNEVGFTARGGGYRSGSSGNFGDLKNYGLFSSLNPNPPAGDQSHMDMQGGSGNTLVHTSLGERTGISVRCLRD